MTGIRILQDRIKHLNEISKRHFLLTSLSAGLGDNDTLYNRYTLRLDKNNGEKPYVFASLKAKQARLIIESLIDFFLIDREISPLLYAF